MIIGTLELDLRVRESHSLKARRRVVRSLKDRVKSKFNVSVADVGDQDVWQRVRLGVALVANDRRFADEVLSKVLDLVRSDPRVELLGHTTEID